jgi:enterochelin esterase-like enzyme
VREEPIAEPPAWLSSAAEPGRLAEIEVPVRALDASVSVRVWSPPATGPDERLPLLVVHDGPEYDARASLTRYLSAGIAGHWLPPLRAALLSPGPRDRWYSASARYARALSATVLPAITGRVATSSAIGLGASLGGLALLHAHYRRPDTFDGLFLQSGSFFWPPFDASERSFRYYRRIVAFVTQVHAEVAPPRPVPTVLTCGMFEENIDNNRLMAKTLRGQGYPATLHEVGGGHDYPAWRDALDPYLTELLGRVSR